MSELKLKVGDREVAIFVILAALVFFMVMFKTTGLRLLLGLLILFWLPIYIILGRFNLERIEKIIFSFFISMGVFPTIVYYLGIFISLRISIAITFLLLTGIAITSRKLPK